MNRAAMLRLLLRVSAVALLVIMLGAGAVANASSVTAVSPTASTTAAMATAVEYQVEFTATSGLPSGGTITLDAPSDVGLSTSSDDYYIDTDPGQSDANGQLVPTISVTNGHEVVITLPSGLTVSAGTVVRIDAYGGTNPASASPNETFAVSTSADTTAVQSNPVSFGLPTQATGVSATENTTSAQASGAELSLTLSTSSDGALSAGNVYSTDSSGYVQITGPSGMSFAGINNEDDVELISGSHDGPPGGVLGIRVDPGGAGNNVIDVYSPGIAASAPVTIRLYGVRNPSSPQSGNLTVTTSSDATPVLYPLDTGVATGITDVSTSVLSPSADATRVSVQATFTATTAISDGYPSAPYPQEGNGGYVQLVAPQGTVFSGSGNGLYYSFDYTFVDDTTGSFAGLIPYPVVDPGGAGDNVVDIYAPTNVAAGDTVTVTAYAVENPQSVNSGGTLSVASSSDVLPSSQPDPIDAPSSPTDVSSTLSSNTPGASGVTYTVDLTATHPLTAADPNLYGSYSGAADPESFVAVASPGATFPTDTSDYTIDDTTSGQTLNPDQVAVFGDDAGSADNANVDIDAANVSVAAGDRLVMTITGVQNPTSSVGALNVSTSSDPGGTGLPVPTDVVATAGDASAALTWDAPDESGISDYIVTPYIGSTPQPAFDVGSAATSATVGNLLNGTTYTFTVSAVTSSGEGGQSAASNAVTPIAPSGGSGSGGSGGGGSGSSGGGSSGGAPSTPGFATSTGQLDFGEVATKAAQTVTVTSAGTGPLQITGTTIGGADPGDFAITTDGCTGHTIPAAGACTVTVTFTPTQDGSRTATLAFSDDASGAPQTVSLSGTGEVPEEITGKVTEGNVAGDPPDPRASVEACTDGFDSGADNCHTVMTSAEGTYVISGLKPGNWSLAAQSFDDPAVSIASAAVDLNAGPVTQNFLLSVPTPLSGGVSFDTAANGSISSGVPSVEPGQPFSYSIPVTGQGTGTPNTTQTYSVLTGVGPSDEPSTGSSEDQAGIVLYAIHYGANGDADRMSRVITGQLQCGTGTASCAEIASGADGGEQSAVRRTYGRSSRRDGGVVASAAAACPPPSAGLHIVPNAYGGITIQYITLSGAEVDIPVVQLQIPTPPTTGNPFSDVAVNLGVAAANATINGTFPELGAYNAAVGALGAAANAAQAGVNQTPGTLSGVGGALLTAAGAGLQVSTHGTFYWFYSITTATAAGLGNPTTSPAPDCPPPTRGGGSIYTDPSGHVSTPSGVPVSGAKVTLLRSASRPGKLRAVRNGSTVMSTLNRRDPDHTNLLGLYGWDVLPGFYRIKATKPGCHAAKGSAKIVESPLLQVPPPATDVTLHLSCPKLKRVAVKLALKVDPVPGARHALFLSASVRSRTRRGPAHAASARLGTVTFKAGRSLIREVVVNPRTGVADVDALVPGSTKAPITAIFSGNALLAGAKVTARR